MRERFKYLNWPDQDAFSINWSLTTNQHPTSYEDIVGYYKNTYATRYRAFYEWIDDNLHAPKGWGEHDVQHYKCYVMPLKASGGMLGRCTEFGIVANNTTFWNGLFPIAQIPVNWTSTSLADPFGDINQLSVALADGSKSITLAYDPDPLIASAWDAMLPYVKPRILSLSELYQLRDIKPGVSRTIQRLSSFQKALRPIEKTVERLGPLKRVMRVARKIPAILGDIYLQYKFNVQPTISDIAAVHTALSSVHQEVEKLLAGQRKQRRQHISYSLKGVYRDSFETRTPPILTASFTTYQIYAKTYGMLNRHYTLPFSSDKVYRDVRYPVARFTATMEYHYEYSELQKKNLELKALLDALGVGSNPLKDIWEVIPWSFVVDWVVGVSQWLDQFRTTPRTKPTTVIDGWCWSHHVRRTIQFRTHLHESGGLYPRFAYDTDIPTCNTWEDAYLRSTRGIMGWTSLVGRGITSQEVVLSSALLATRT
jgi:hypothetical protein